jgi:lysine 2,3-aminomutase
MSALPPAPLTAEREDSRTLAAVAARYAVAITPLMEGLIDPADPADPIAAQFRPDVRELDESALERADPIADFPHTPVKGVVHRYPDRALLKVTHACPVYCRFCFRREMVGPGGDGTLSPAEIDAGLAYIAATPAIWEVILTGGDPLILKPERIAALTTRLASIPHVRIIRWHTRVPVVAPDRITPALVQALLSTDATTWVAVHTNHIREFTPEGDAAIARLANAGIPLVSQTVLLKGVNDTAEALEALMRGLVERRIKPYYLHHPDLAPGTGHFRSTVAEGQALVRTLHARASGLCQPTYVLDVPDGGLKAPLTPSYLSRDADGIIIDTGESSVRYPSE